MERSAIRELFHLSIQRYLFGLFTEYGFKKHEINNDEFCFESEECKVRFLIYWGHVPSIEMTVIPVNKKELGIALIAKMKDCVDLSKLGKFRKLQKIEIIVRSYAKLFLDYCVPLMEENFKNWHQYETFSKKIYIDAVKRKNKVIK